MNFGIRTDDGDTVSTQRQSDLVWASTPYGGRVVAGDVVGTWRTIQALGCYLTCFSMISKFYGTDCRPDDLNEFARENRLYEPTTRGLVDWLTGQKIGDTVHLVVTAEGKAAFRDGDKLLLEHEGRPESPVAVVVLIPPYTGQARRGIIERRFAVADSLIIEGDRLRAYSLLNPARGINRYGGALRYTMEVVWPSMDGAVDLIESAMLLEHPVVIHTKFGGGSPQHWVVADGMRPRWDVSGQKRHRGTYRIHDPGATRDDLLDEPYLNKIGRAVITEPVQLLDQGDESTLVLTLSGSAVLEVSDPSGGRLVWNAETSSYESTIEGCSILPGYSIAEPGDSIPDFLLDFVEIRNPAPGDYLVEVAGTSADGFALNIGAHDPPQGYRSAFRGGETEAGGSHYFMVAYSDDPDSSLGVRELDPAHSPEDRADSPGLTWSVRPNPAAPGTDVVFLLEAPSDVRIGVFDVTGRRIVSLVNATVPRGLQRVRWDGRAQRKVRERRCLLRSDGSGRKGDHEEDRLHSLGSRNTRRTEMGRYLRTWVQTIALLSIMGLWSQPGRGGDSAAPRHTAAASERWLSLVFEGDIENVTIVDPRMRSADLRGSQIPECQVWRETVIDRVDGEPPFPEVILANVPDPLLGKYEFIASARDSTILMINVTGHVWGGKPCGVSLTARIPKSMEASRSVVYVPLETDSCMVWTLCE